MSKAKFAMIVAGAMLTIPAAGHCQSGSASPAASMPELSWVFSVDVKVDAPIEQGEINGGTTRFIPIKGEGSTDPACKARF